MRVPDTAWMEAPRGTVAALAGLGSVVSLCRDPAFPPTVLTGLPFRHVHLQLEKIQKPFFFFQTRPLTVGKDTENFFFFQFF